MKLAINILISLFILIFISACGGGGGSSSSSGITSFDASSATITIGDSTDLTAVFISSGVGNIDNNIGSVTSETPVTVTPSTTTTYTLSVTKSDGSVDTATVTITVVAINALNILDESLDQVFQTTQPDYTASVGFLAKSIQINAIPADAGSSITVNGSTVGTGNLSQLVSLSEGVDTVIDIIVTQNDVSKSYSLTVSRALAASFAEQAILGASNADVSDEFGYVVALSGDTLAVGVPSEESSTQGIDTTPDNLAVSAGAVYVFIRSAGSWSEQAYIKASNAEAGDKFGTSVALSGDTLVVGAIGEASSSTGVDSTADELAANAGAAYVYIRTGSNWSEQAYIKASNTQGSDEFGSSVAVYADTLAVGAILEDSDTKGVNTTPNNDISNSGAVYVFSRSDSNWTQQAYIKASNAGGGDEFGISLALFGDTLAVGAYLEDSSTPGINQPPLDDKASDNYGAVYIFVKSNTVWAEQAYIKASHTDKVDWFGFSIALSDDTLAVGAHFDDSETTGTVSVPSDTAAGANSGAVYVFTRSSNSWSQQAYIKASNTGKTDLFGRSVALSGDILAVGAIQEDSDIAGINQGSNTATRDFGAVYVFSRTDTSWSEQYFIKASVTVSDVEFGHNVALAGDTLAVGVPLDTASTGEVYIFE